MKRGLTCTIITLNEEDRIERCIRSVLGIADEIVVIDSGSTDRTVAICQALGAHCFHHPWEGFGPQKRFAESKASHRWILNLDADEWLTEQAQEDILAVLSLPESQLKHGYACIIRQVYPHRDKPRLWADCHRYVRLYDVEFCRFPPSTVFDEITVAPEHRGVLQGEVMHQSIRSLSHLVSKNIKYFHMQKAEIGKFAPLYLVRIVLEPLFAFFKYYVLKRHFTGGVYGFIVASTIAALRSYRIAVLYLAR